MTLLMMNVLDTMRLILTIIISAVHEYILRHEIRMIPAIDSVICSCGMQLKITRTSNNLR